MGKEANHVASRRCYICRKKGEKEIFFRLALLRMEKRLIFDRQGKAGGRGLYICRDNECVERFRGSIVKGKVRAFSGYSKTEIDCLVDNLKNNISSNI